MLISGSFDILAPAPTFRMEAEAGRSLAEIVAAVPDLPSWFWEYGEVRVDGHLIYREHWLRFRPLERTRLTGEPVVVTLWPPAPEGGRGKQVAGLLASIVLAVATAGIAGGALAPMLGASFAAGSVGANLLAAGVGIVGRMLITALTPPPVAPNVAGGAESRIQAGITGNVIAVDRPLPAVVGRMLYSPPHLIRPYTTVHGQDGELRVHAIVALAGRHLIEDVQINGVAVADMDGVTLQTREGKPDDAALTLNATIAVEDQPAIQMSKIRLADPADPAVEDQETPENSNPKWHIVRTRGTFKRFRIRLLFRAGLFKNEDSGPQRAILPVRVGFRKRGDETWINGPELHFSRGKLAAGEYRREISFEMSPNPPTSALPVDEVSNQPQAYWRAAQGQAFEYAANSYFNPGIGNFARRVARYTEGYLVYLGTSTFDEGEYEFRLMRGSAFGATDFDAGTYAFDGSIANAFFFTSVDDDGTWVAAEAQDRYVDDLLVESVLTETDDYVFGQTGDVTLVSLQADAVQVNSISATFTSYAPVWKDGNWATIEPTSNPAALYRYVVLTADPGSSEGEEMIEPDNLEEFFAACVEKGYECNAVVDGLSVDQVKQIIASAGWAAPIYGGLQGVVRERDRSEEPISQKFTPLDSANMTVMKEWNDLPHALRVEFFDEDENYQLRDTYVYADGYNRDTAVRIEAITDQGTTKRAKVRDKYLLMLRQIYRRRRPYSLECGPRVVKSRRGTLVGVTSDVLSVYHQFSLLKDVITAGAEITGIRLRAPVDMAFSMTATPGAALSLADGSQILVRVAPAPGETDTLTLYEPMPINADLVPDSVVSVGQIGQEYRRCIIQGIEWNKDLSSNLTLLDAADDIFEDGCVAPAEEEAPNNVVTSAWAFVGISDVVTANGGNIVLGEPAGVEEGDLLAALIAFRDESPFSAASGWDEAAQELNPATVSGRSRSSAAMFWRRRGASAPSFTFTRSGGGVAHGRVIAFRGAAETGVLDVASQGLTYINGETLSWQGIPELVTSSGDELIVMMTAQAPEPPVGILPPSGVTSVMPSPDEWTARGFTSTTIGDDVGLSVATAIKKSNGGTGELAINAISGTSRNATVAAAFKSINS